MGGTPAGIMVESWALTSASNGGSRGDNLGVTVSVTMAADPTLRKTKRQEVPRPGRAVRGSTTGRPLMAALDLLGRRWSLRVLWELRDGPLGARALRARCDAMSPSVLYQRLAELSEAGLVVQDDESHYQLTAIGRALGAALDPLDRWAQHWAGGAVQTIASGP